MLEGHGFGTFPCDTMVKALKIAQGQEIGIAIGDFVDPKSPGLTILQQLHTIQPSLHAIVYSDPRSFTSVKEALNHGAFAYVEKPEGHEALIPQIKHAQSLPTKQSREHRSLPQNHQHLLQEVVDRSPDWIFVHDLDHRFLLVNKSFAASQRLKPQDMIGRQDTDFWTLEFCEGNDAKGIRGFHADDRETFKGQLIHNPHDPATLHNGTVRVYDTFKGPLRNNEGRILGVLCYCRDVTEQRQAEASFQKAKDELELRVTKRTDALRQSQPLLQNIVENIPLAVFVKDPKDEFRIRLWNKGAEAIFGIPRLEMIGRNSQDFWPQDQADLYLSYDLKTIEDGVLQDIPEKPSVHRKNGSILLHTRRVPLYDGQGQCTLLLALCENITERRRKEFGTVTAATPD